MTDLHPTIAAFPTQHNELLIGGIPLTRLADRVGSTPFFAYDRAMITERVALVRQALPTRVAVSYAVKANPMPAVVGHLAGLVDGLDVASGAEMKTALDSGVAPTSVSFAGPGKSESELAMAVAAGILIELESETELRRVIELAHVTGRRPRVAVRVNPDFAVKGSAMKMGGGPAQFGVDAEQVPALLKRLGEVDVQFVGFHIFSGSQNLNAEVLANVQEETVKLAVRLARLAPAPIEHLNIGGGFGIPYFPVDRPLDLQLLGQRLAETLDSNLGEEYALTRVVVELGRFLVGEAGVYVCSVTDRKTSRGEVFVVTDGGLHHHLAASGNFGQVLRRNYPVAVGTRIGATERSVVNVVGPLCTPLDLLGDKVELAPVEIGDLIVVFLSGAYGLTASPTAFLSHPSPVEVLV